MSAPKVGQWVRVWGQVVEGNSHPEDAIVEFFSHNEQWAGDVRLDRLEAAQPPPFARQCNSMLESPATKNLFLRCELTHGHSGDHRSDQTRWSASVEHGAFEDYR